MIIRYIPEPHTAGASIRATSSRHNGKKKAKKGGDKKDGSSLMQLLIDKISPLVPAQARVCTFETPCSFQ